MLGKVSNAASRPFHMVFPTRPRPYKGRIGTSRATVDSQPSLQAEDAYCFGAAYIGELLGS